MKKWCVASLPSIDEKNSIFAKNILFLVIIILIILIISPLVLADYCQDLKYLIESSNEQKCGDANYKSFADIDKDGSITLIDLILVDNNSPDQQWCLQRLIDNSNPCGSAVQASGYGGAGGVDMSGTSGSSGYSGYPDYTGGVVPADITNQQTESQDIISAGGIQLKKPTPNLILLWISALIVIIVIMICLYFLIKHLIEIRKNKISFQPKTFKLSNNMKKY